MFGGVRFGGTLTLDSAFELGFDHVALCMGAGRPTVIPMKNGLARGVRQASDFLMALQLTGRGEDGVARESAGPHADRRHRRRPDRHRYRDRIARLLRRAGREVPRPLRDAGRRTRARRSCEQRGRTKNGETAEEFLAHARAIRAERQAAASGRPRAAT